MKTILNGLAIIAISLSGAGAKEIKLLNVSYDPTRELYQDVNTAFAKYWQGKTGDKLTIQQSHGGFRQQVRSVNDGVQANVVTIAPAHEIDALFRKGKILPADSQKRVLHNKLPYTLTLLFLVRKG